MKLAQFVKAADGSRFAIERFYLTAQQVYDFKIRAIAKLTLHDEYELEPGEYVRLVDKELGQIVMSDTPMEQRTNAEVVRRARGHVLVAGLGIGMILRPMLANKRVKSVTVIEKYAEIIDLNRRAGFDVEQPKLSVINADIFTWLPPANLYDVIYFDIWNVTGSENGPEMDALHDKYRGYVAPKGWMESWRRADCQKELNPEVKRFYTKLLREQPLAALIIASAIKRP